MEGRRSRRRRHGKGCGGGRKEGLEGRRRRSIRKMHGKGCGGGVTWVRQDRGSRCGRKGGGKPKASDGTRRGGGGVAGMKGEKITT